MLGSRFQPVVWTAHLSTELFDLVLQPSKAARSVSVLGCACAAEGPMFMAAVVQLAFQLSEACLNTCRQAAA